MLNYMQKLANRLAWFSGISRILSVALLITLIYFLVFVNNIEVQDQWLMPLLIAFIWLVNLAVFLHIFQMGQLSPPKNGWWKKLKYWVMYWLKSIVALVFILLTLAAIFFTFRILSI